MVFVIHWHESAMDEAADSLQGTMKKSSLGVLSSWLMCHFDMFPKKIFFFACFWVLHYFLWTQDAPGLFCISPSLVLKSITSAKSPHSFWQWYLEAMIWTLVLFIAIWVSWLLIPNSGLVYRHMHIYVFLSILFQSLLWYEYLSPTFISICMEYIF